MIFCHPPPSRTSPSLDTSASSSFSCEADPPYGSHLAASLCQSGMSLEAYKSYHLVASPIAQ